MEPTQLAGGLVVTDASLNKVDYGDLALSRAIDSKMDDRPHIQEDILDFDR